MFNVLQSCAAVMCFSHMLQSCAACCLQAISVACNIAQCSANDCGIAHTTHHVVLRSCLADLSAVLPCVFVLPMNHHTRQLLPAHCTSLEASPACDDCMFFYIIKALTMHAICVCHMSFSHASRVRSKKHKPS